jgi:exopolyphosphatase / guanosine-5'-triphosphate,3'-diphosphate pyrophosphatase
MPSLKGAFFSLFAYFCLFLFIFSPLKGNEPTTLACDCDQSSYVEPQQVVPQLQTQEKVVRAAIDIGSGATKLRVADVNLKTHKIEKILVNESFPVQYQENLAKSPNNTFDDQVMQTGIEAIRKSAEIAKQYHAQKIIAVATASFRKAANSQALIDKIYNETGVKVYVIDQDLEGKLAFNAVLSQGNYDPLKLIVWDIGGGSLQLTTFNPKGDYHIFRGDIASIQFKNRVIQEIQHKDINKTNTPNPMTEPEIKQGIAMAREDAQKVDHIFKDRVSRPDTQMVGVGNIFAYGIYPICGNKSPYTVQELNQATLGLANKDDQQVGGGDYANVQVTNAILVLGYMEQLNIPKMDILDINNADGALLYQDFWNT